MIDGVCGGIAKHFSIDPTLVRIFWVLLTIFGGSGVILYIAAMIIMPKEDSVAGAEPPARVNHDHNTKFWGFLLLGLGVFWLLGNLGFPLWHHWWGFPWRVGVPLLLILAGVAFLFGGRSYVSARPSVSDGPQPEGTESSIPAAEAGNRRLYRSRSDKKIMGICGGIGAHVDVDPVIVRLLFVVVALATTGFAIILYLVAGLVIPMEPAEVPAAQPTLS